MIGRLLLDLHESNTPPDETMSYSEATDPAIMDSVMVLDLMQTFPSALEAGMPSACAPIAEVPEEQESPVRGTEIQEEHRSTTSSKSTHKHHARLT